MPNLLSHLFQPGDEYGVLLNRDLRLKPAEYISDPRKLVFNPRRIPGSVVVYKNNQATDLIVVVPEDTLDLKKGQRVLFGLFGPLSNPHAFRVVGYIPPGTYAEVKAALIHAHLPPWEKS